MQHGRSGVFFLTGRAGLDQVPDSISLNPIKASSQVW